VAYSSLKVELRFMKLSPKETLTLAAAELQPHAPTASLCKETGLREHTIRYSLRRLQERGVCTPIPFMNLHRLGYNIFNVFFSISAQKRSQKESFLRSLGSAPDIVWIGEFGGEFQYGIAVVTKQLITVVDLFNRLAEKYEDIFFEKAISYQTSATIFRRQYLSTKKFKVKPLSTRYSHELAEIDELDDRLLRRMADIGEVSNRKLAQLLGIPTSTIDLRMRRLAEKGIISGHMLAVDCTKYEMQAFKLLLYVKGLNTGLSKALHEFSEKHPNITYLIECLGTWDFEIGAEVSSTEEVTLIIQELYDHFGSSLNTIKLLSRFKDIKYRWYPG